MRNNKGLSLVELLIVITILAVISSGTFISINSIYGLNAKKCTNQIYSYLGKTKIEAMSKSSAVLEIYQGPDKNYYAKLSTETEPIKIGKSTLEISYFTNNNPSKHVISQTNPLKLTFDRSSGSLQPLEGSTDFCEKIVVGTGSKELAIDIIPETGKFFIE